MWSQAYIFIAEKIVPIQSYKSIFFIIGIIVAVVFFVKGLYHVISALRARIDITEYKQGNLKYMSNLFFGSISKRKYDEYYKSFLEENEGERLNDILSQIYINSQIAQIKHGHYNKGIIWVSVSILSIVILVIWGSVGF